MGVKLYVFFLIALAARVIHAEYSQQELFLVQWGNASNQFDVSHPCHNVSPIDSTDYIAPGRGPNQAFIDGGGNIVISSYYRQIKGFKNDGHLIFSYSSGEISNFEQVVSGNFCNLYVDSNFQLYVVQDFSPYVSLMDYSGVLLGRLYPFPDSINTRITIFKWSPLGVLGFKEKDYGWVTYSNGSFMRSGWLGVLASDGYFYRAFSDEDYPHTLFIGKFADVDSFGNPGYKYIKSIELDMGTCDTLYDANEIPGGDGSKIYIMAIIDSCETGYSMIWEYDLEFHRVDELRFPDVDDFGYVCPNPIIGPDGSIYEFRATDDGLHVIKWTKQ